MVHDRKSLEALRNLISEADLILETTPPLPENHTAACCENLKAAIVLADDLLKCSRMNAAALLGRKGGSTTARTLGAGALPAHGCSTQNSWWRQTAQAS